MTKLKPYFGVKYKTKTLFWGQILAKMNFPGKKGSVSF